MPQKNQKNPRIYVPKSALIALVDEVLMHPQIETGSGEWGIIMEDHISVILTHIIQPIPEDIERGYARLTFGGGGQLDAIRWLAANEALLQKHLGKMLQGRCAYLGKAHSHDELEYSQYSPTDIKSIVESVKDDGLEVAVGPLLLITKPGAWTFAKDTDSLVLSETTSVKLKFYYYSKVMLDAGFTEPILVTPKIIESKSAPMLPPLGWQFTNDADFYEQLRHFHSYGAKVDIVYREVKGGPPMEIVFTVDKPQWRGMLVIITPWNYPEGQPRFHVIPIEGRAAILAGNYPPEAGLIDGDLWRPGEDFIEAAFRLEARGEL